MRFALVAQRATETNRALIAAAPRGIDFCIVPPEQALDELRVGDAALGRLDVLPTLDGVDDGLWALGSIAARGVRTLNRASTLLAAHDKLLTARILSRAGLPHPHTRLHEAGATLSELTLPVVLKPRFGSWGRDVVRCETEAELLQQLVDLESRTWYRRQGVLVQQLVPPQGHDLRIVVAGGVVVGAISRISRQGEWRTNVALGAKRTPVTPTAAASELALRAAEAAGADLLGVDLLPDGHGSYCVLELNGAVDFTADYSLDRDVFAAAAWELARVSLDRSESALGQPRTVALASM
jgi:RimK family alpha-L-glutamate ligase